MTPAALLVRALEFSVVAAAALTAVTLLRHRSAALRHWVLTAAVIATPLMPLMTTVPPSWRMPVRAAFETAFDTAAGPLERLDWRRAPANPVDDGHRLEPTDPSRWAALPTILLTCWVTGVAVNGVVLLVGLARLRRERLRSRPVQDPRLVSTAAEIATACGLRRSLSLSETERPDMLVTWGTARPHLLLPSAARHWSNDRLAVVFRHELAHVKRGDWLVQVAAECVRAFHWFNPLAWMICRRLRHESERAADDAVLSAGVDGRDYAAQLLDLARAMTARRETWWPAPAIVRPSTLERRVAAMLASDMNRAPLTRSARALTLAATLAIAAAVVSAQGALASFSGSVLDPSNRTVPGVEVTVTNVATNAARKVRSDDTGRFEFADLPQGDYEFEAKFPGFMALRGRVKIAGEHVQQPLTLELGTVQETILVVSDGTPAAHTQVGVGEPSQKRRAPIPRSTCESSPHGGNIRPPLKLVDVRPFYPPHLATAGVAGVVQLQAVIAKDGALKDLRVVHSAHPDLDAAALAAVRQWEFTGTMLNCMPIDVAIGIKLEFRAS